LRFWSICASHTSSAISTGPPGAEPPTLFTSTSTRPMRAISAATAALSVTSQACPSKRPPASPTRSAVSRIASGARSTPITRAPSPAKATAVARPLPQPGPTEPAPVTSTTLSTKRPRMRFPLSRQRPRVTG
jgi:hypothetical protein